MIYGFPIDKNQDFRKTDYCVFEIKLTKVPHKNFLLWTLADQQ